MQVQAERLDKKQLEKRIERQQTEIKKEKENSKKANVIINYTFNTVLYSLKKIVEHETFRYRD